MINLLIAGSRDFTDYSRFKEIVISFLQKIKDENPGITREEFQIVSGGARGADALAYEFGKAKGFTTTVIEADWNKYGKQAGMIRNQVMARLLEANRGGKNYVLCFWDGKSRGTKGMMDLAIYYKLDLYVSALSSTKICQKLPLDR